MGGGDREQGLAIELVTTYLETFNDSAEVIVYLLLNKQDAMEMVGHNHCGENFDVGIMTLYRKPTIPYLLT